MQSIKQLSLFAAKEIVFMTLVYLLIGFTGITGAAIAKDGFAKLEAPAGKTSKALSCKSTAGDTA